MDTIYIGEVSKETGQRFRQMVADAEAARVRAEFPSDPVTMKVMFKRLVDHYWAEQYQKEVKK